MRCRYRFWTIIGGTEVKIIPADAKLDNTVLLVIDVIRSCAHEQYKDPQRDIH